MPSSQDFTYGSAEQSPVRRALIRTVSTAPTPLGRAEDPAWKPFTVELGAAPGSPPPATFARMLRRPARLARRRLPR